MQSNVEVKRDGKTGANYRPIIDHRKNESLLREWKDQICQAESDSLAPHLFLRQKNSQDAPLQKKLNKNKRTETQTQPMEGIL